MLADGPLQGPRPIGRTVKKRKWNFFFFSVYLHQVELFELQKKKNIKIFSFTLLLL